MEYSFRLKIPKSKALSNTNVVRPLVIAGFSDYSDNSSKKENELTMLEKLEISMKSSGTNNSRLFKVPHLKQ